MWFIGCRRHYKIKYADAAWGSESVGVSWDEQVMLDTAGEDLWALTHGHTGGGWPAKTYILQLCADTGCRLENLTGMIDNRGGWLGIVREREREREGGGVKEIRAIRMTCWRWLLFQFIFFFYDVQLNSSEK